MNALRGKKKKGEGAVGLERAGAGEEGEEEEEVVVGDVRTEEEEGGRTYNLRSVGTEPPSGMKRDVRFGYGVLMVFAMAGLVSIPIYTGTTRLYFYEIVPLFDEHMRARPLQAMPEYSMSTYGLPMLVLFPDALQGAAAAFFPDRYCILRKRLNWLMFVNWAITLPAMSVLVAHCAGVVESTAIGGISGLALALAMVGLAYEKLRGMETATGLAGVLSVLAATLVMYLFLLLVLQAGNGVEEPEFAAGLVAIYALVLVTLTFGLWVAEKRGERAPFWWTERVRLWCLIISKIIMAHVFAYYVSHY